MSSGDPVSTWRLAQIFEFAISSSDCRVTIATDDDDRLTALKLDGRAASGHCAGAHSRDLRVLTTADVESSTIRHVALRPTSFPLPHLAGSIDRVLNSNVCRPEHLFQHNFPGPGGAIATTIRLNVAARIPDRCDKQDAIGQRQATDAVWRELMPDHFSLHVKIQISDHSNRATSEVGQNHRSQPTRQ